MEAIATFGVVFPAMLAAIFLKRRLVGSLTYWDVIIPCLFLSPVLIGLYTVVLNPSHGAFPVLLLMLYCIVWTIKHPARYLLIVILNSLLIYTCFGLLAGAITPVMLSREVWRGVRSTPRRNWKQPALALLASVISLASFFIGFKFARGRLFSISAPETAGIPFVRRGRNDGAYFRVSGRGLISALIGVAVVVTLIGVLLHHARLLVLSWTRDQFSNVSLVIVVLITFSLLFAFNAAFGRVCLGISSAAAGRYMPYLIPGFLGLYFHLTAVSRKPRAVLIALGLYVALGAFVSLPLGRGGVQMLEDFRRGKEASRR